MNLSKRKDELQKEFDLLQESRKSILEQAKKLQQELTSVDNKIQQTQGAYAEVLKLEESDKPKKVDSKSDKK